MSARVAIVGAGVSGLSAARELVRRGHEVALFEAGERGGGLIGTHHVDGFTLERAASSFVPAEAGAADLAEELGVEVEEAADEARKRWVYLDGALSEVPMGPRQLLTSPLMSWRGKFRVLAEPLQPTKAGADESIAEFCRRRLGDEVTRALVIPFVVGVFGGDAEALSLRACFPKLAALEARGGLVRGALATRVEQVFSRMQGAASAKRGRRILAPVGGLGKLMGALEAELGEVLRTDTTIASIERRDAGLVLHDASGAHHQCDALVLATPAPVTASLVEPYHEDMARALREIPYAPMAVVCLGFDKASLQHPLDGFGFLVGREEKVRILGAVFESTVWSGRAPEGQALVRCMIGGSLDPDVLDLNDAALIDQCRRDLAVILNVRTEPTMRNVVRWPRAIPQYTRGHLDRVKRVEAGANELGIVVAGNPYHGVSLNECIKNGRRVADTVASRLAAVASVAVLMMLLVACGGGRKATAPVAGDGGEIVADSAPDDASAPAPEPGLSKELGKVEIRATWPWPPAELRRSPGRNSCGAARAPMVEVELMGGLGDVAVSADVGAGPERGRLSVQECRISPRLVVVGVGGELLLQNLDQRAHELIIESLDEGGMPTAELGRAPMRIAGHSFAFAPTKPGLLRIHSAADPEDYAYAMVSTGSAQVTGPRGRAELELPVGSRNITVWHPPLPERTSGVKTTLVVDVLPATRSKHNVDLAKVQP